MVVAVSSPGATHHAGTDDGVNIIIASSILIKRVGFVDSLGTTSLGRCMCRFMRQLSADTGVHELVADVRRVGTCARYWGTTSGVLKRLLGVHAVLRRSDDL